jgi:tRNA nucleotidyltransferase (CCA-adding enzyme)
VLKRSPNPYWEHFNHQADIGVRGHGHTLASAFEQAALALTALFTDPSLLVKQSQVRIECKAPDWDLLFTDWLNAVVYQMSTRQMLFCRFRVQINGDKLRASAWGESIDRSWQPSEVEVKGASYTALKVFQHANGDWTAECVVDV